MKNLSVLSLILICTCNSFAEDVVPKEWNTAPANAKLQYVKVIINPDGEVGFEDCIKGDDKTCRQIGNEKFYSKETLKKMVDREKREVGYAIGADVVGLVAAAAGGFLLGGGALATSEFFSWGLGGKTALILSEVVTEGGGVLAVNFIDALNPKEQSRQADTLADDVIADDEVPVDDIKAFIQRLTMVLNK